MFESKIIDKAIDSLNRKDITIISELCPTVRSPKSKCRRCAEFCPTDSISIKNKISINDRCIECGCCISSCPNGVFDSRSRTDSYIVLASKKLIENNEEKIVRFTCEKSINETTGVINLKCIGRLTENILLDLSLSGVNRIDINIKECGKCEGGEKVTSLLNQTKNLSSIILRLIGMAEGKIHLTDGFGKNGKEVKEKIKTGEEISRRGFFKKIKKRAFLETNDIVADLYKDNESKTLSIKEFKKNQNHKRAHLISLLKKFHPEKKFFSGDFFIPFAGVSINGNCIGCNVCDILCPTGAIKRISDENFIRIYFNEQKCTNCSLCCDVCLPKAIRVEQRFSIKNLIEDNGIELVRLNKKICERCKSEFVGENETVCPLCEKRKRNL